MSKGIRVERVGRGGSSEVLLHPRKRVVFKRKAFSLTPKEYEAYKADNDKYLKQLGAAGINTPETKIFDKPEEDGRIRVYIRQPFFGKGNVENLLRGKDSEKLFQKLVAENMRVTETRGLGIDSKPENWFRDASGKLVYADTSPAFLREGSSDFVRMLNKGHRISFPFTLLMRVYAPLMLFSREGILGRLLAYGEKANPAMKQEYRRIAVEHLKKSGGNRFSFWAKYGLAKAEVFYRRLEQALR